MTRLRSAGELHVRLCVDEDLRSGELLNRLRNAGHDVIALDKGLTDEEVWGFAQQHDAAVLTGNAADFTGLALTDVHHAGLLIVLAEGDATRDMTPRAIARAIERISDRHPTGLRGLTVVVNHYRS
ncbi:MAG: DUF5615 family PIN-like protein [Chloroflexota bacterium]